MSRETRRDHPLKPPRLSRRQVLATVPLTAAALLGVDDTVLAGTNTAVAGREIRDSFPRQDPALVRDVVLKSHFDLTRVKELVTVRPELAKSAVDWGFGDWESALGAASHTGRRAIASLLIDNGARPNLFTHAMFGHLEPVQAAIAAQPGIQRIPGPHGITLLAHAKAGGEPARGVVEYLEKVGDADPRPAAVEHALPAAAYVGTYRYAPAETFEIVSKDGDLLFEKEGMFPRSLVHVGDGVHHPVGAPSVRLEFLTAGKSASRIEIQDGQRRIVARRIVD